MTMDKNKNPSKTFTKILSAATGKVTEALFFSGIPIIQTVEKIRHEFFLDKIKRFELELSEIPKNKIDDFVKRLETDEKFNQKIGKGVIISIIDRLDDVEKASLAAKAFKAHLLRKINLIQFQRLINAIDRLIMCDIDKLHEFANTQESGYDDLTVSQNFLNAGLAYTKTGFGVGGVHPNDTCKLFVKYIL